MATVTTTQVIDDLDGTPGATTIRFSVGRSHWEIDLCEANTEQLYEALQPFISKARKAASGKAGTAQRPKQTLVREWAKLKGLPVSDRGRVSNDLVEQYRAEHS